MRTNIVSVFKKGVANLTLLAVLATNMICPALAMEVPVSSTEVDINGQKMLTEVYETNRNLDPETLIKDDFQRNGFTYTFDTIVKEEAEAVETRDVTHNVEKKSKTDNLSENIKLFDSSIPYIDKDGFEGTIYLDVDSIKTTADGYTNKSRNVSTTKTYTGLQYNDPTLIPDTINKDGQQLELQDVSWSENTLVENGSVPSTYTAQATYGKASSVKVATGYTITATYAGTVSLDKDAGVKYTISYLGTLAPVAEEQNPDEGDGAEKPADNEVDRIHFSVSSSTIIIILLAVLIIFMAFFMYYTVSTMKRIVPAAWQQPPQLLPPPNNNHEKAQNLFEGDTDEGNPKQ